MEKSRITYQAPNERCYHIFYNMMSDAVPSLKKEYSLSNNVRDYHFVSQGKITVDSIDDKEDMGFVDEAFDILGFTKQEKLDVYKLVAVVMHLGEVKFKKRSSKDDQVTNKIKRMITFEKKKTGNEPLLMIMVANYLKLKC